MVQRLGFHEIVVRFHFLQLRGGGDDEKPRFARALFVKQPNQVRSNERVACDLDGELAAVGRRLEFDARSIQPSLGRPRIELADGRKRVGRADLDGNAIGACSLNIPLSFELPQCLRYANSSLMSRPLLTSCTGRLASLCKVCAD